MRPFATLFLLLAFGSAQAALNTESLPAGAVGIVGFDVTAFRATKVGQAIVKFAELKAKNIEASRQLNEKLGIDSAKDLTEVVVGIYPGADGKVAADNASGVVLIRGKFQPAAIDAFGTKNGLPSKTFGNRQAWKAGPFIEKLSGEKPKDKAQVAYLVAYSPSLIMIASEEFLGRALDAADRHEKTSLLPAGVAKRFQSVPNGWAFLYADLTKTNGTKQEIGAENLALALGENAADLSLAATADFVSPEKADATLKLLKGLQGAAMIGLMNDAGKSPEEKENMTLLSELVQKIRLGGEGKTITLDLDFPADKAMKAILKAIEKSQQVPAAPAK
jgi:hypothetical protein